MYWGPISDSFDMKPKKLPTENQPSQNVHSSCRKFDAQRINSCDFDDPLSFLQAQLTFLLVLYNIVTSIRKIITNIVGSHTINYIVFSDHLTFPLAPLTGQTLYSLTEISHHLLNRSHEIVWAGFSFAQQFCLLLNTIIIQDRQISLALLYFLCITNQQMLAC